MSPFDEFVETIRALRDPDSGCPWDLEQTHESLRRYMIEFLQLFASHLSAPQLTEIRRAASQEDIDSLFNDDELPVRGGCNEDITEAA